MTNIQIIQKLLHEVENLCLPYNRKVFDDLYVLRLKTLARRIGTKQSIVIRYIVDVLKMKGFKGILITSKREKGGNTYIIYCSRNPQNILKFKELFKNEFRLLKIKREIIEN